MLKKLAAVSALVAMSASLSAAVVVIEGFENNTDPGAWGNTSPSPQRTNFTVTGNVPNYVATNVTEGAAAGSFTGTWTVPGAAVVSPNVNVYVSGGPLTYWSMRLNLASPDNLRPDGTNPQRVTANSILAADVRNDNPYPIQLALYVGDAGFGQLERGPLTTVAANTSTTITWNLATEPATSFITGNNVINGPTRFAGIFVYTETEPTSTAFTLFVDNIRDTNAQTDTTAPAAPVVRSVRQGTNPGELVVSWAPNTEGDLAEYRVYLATNANFGTPTTNRLAMPGTPAATVAAGTNTVTLTGVPTDEPVYITVTAVDNATPVANQSDARPALGARLNPTGALGSDLIVLDLDRNLPGGGSFATEGYFHNVVYAAQALTANGRYFGSASAASVDAGTTVLTPNANGLVIWNNALDGDGLTAPAGQALSAASRAALTTFMASPDANLLISGTGLGEDLKTKAADPAFLTNVLKADLAADNVNATDITGIPAFFNAGSFATGTDIFNAAAFATGDNESLLAVGGSVAQGAYSPATASAGGSAAILDANKLVFLGFGFESVRETTASTSFNAGAAKRAALMQDIILYLLPQTDAHTWTLFE